MIPVITRDCKVLEVLNEHPATTESVNSWCADLASSCKCEWVTCQENSHALGFSQLLPREAGRVCGMVPFKQEGWKLKPEHSVATGESSEESAVRDAGPPSPCLERDKEQARRELK